MLSTHFSGLRLFAITIWVHFVVYFVLFVRIQIQIHMRPGGAKLKCIYLGGDVIFLSLALHKKITMSTRFWQLSGLSSIGKQPLTRSSANWQVKSGKLNWKISILLVAGEKLKKKKTIFTHSQPQIKLGFICEQGKVMQIFGFPRKCIHLRRSINRQTLSLAWEIKKITHAEIETHTLNPIPFDIPLNPHLIIHSPHIMHLASAQLFCSRSA